MEKFKGTGNGEPGVVELNDSEIEKLEKTDPNKLMDQAVLSVEESKRWMEISRKAKELLNLKPEEEEIVDGLLIDPSFRETSMRDWREQDMKDLANGLVIRLKAEIEKKKELR